MLTQQPQYSYFNTEHHPNLHHADSFQNTSQGQQQQHHHQQQGGSIIHSSNNGTPDYSQEEYETDYKYGGYHPVEIHEKLGKHHNYKIIRKLGWGQFSTVWLAYNSIDSQYYALKIVKSAKNYTEAAFDEIKILEKINKTDPEHPGYKHLVTLHEWFYHNGPNGKHVVMVFEVLGESLLGVLQNCKDNYKSMNLEELGETYGGLPIPIVKRMTKQICLAMDYLHRKCGLIHTDLKPENIMVEIRDLDKFTSLIQDHSHNGPIKSSNPLPSPLVSQHSFKKSGSVSTRSSVSYNGSNYTTEVLSNNASISPAFQPTRLSSCITTSEASSDEEEEEEEEAEDVVEDGDSDGYYFMTRRTTTTSTSEVNSDDEDEELDENTEVITPRIQKDENRPEENDEEEEDLSSLINIKIADLGNACYYNHHFSNDIQTRQYRAPEILLGSKWGCSTDCWSVGCLVFELITGDYLFSPKSGRNYDKNDDHIAQILELLNPDGKELLSFLKRCDYRNDYFEIINNQIQLKRIKSLKYWSLIDVFQEKYHTNAKIAKEIAEFLEPLLNITPSNRPDLGGWSNHEWLKNVDGFLNRPCGCHGEDIKGWNCRYKESERKKS